VLCIAGAVIAVLLVLVFGLDLATKIPFRRASIPMDIGFLVAAALLAFISWTTLKEQS
jgi:NADH:ubiquinone oxidoreductase subunit 6 (subunit J)